MYKQVKFIGLSKHAAAGDTALPYIRKARAGWAKAAENAMLNMAAVDRAERDYQLRYALSVVGVDQSLETIDGIQTRLDRYFS